METDLDLIDLHASKLNIHKDYPVYLRDPRLKSAKSAKPKPQKDKTSKDNKETLIQDTSTIT